MAVIRINDLKVRTIIGVNSWERVNKQELIINITIEYDASQACLSDQLKDALNYETVATKIVKTLERSKYILLEKLVHKLLGDIMADLRVISAHVRVDKPHALPEARCVSFELSGER